MNYITTAISLIASPAIALAFAATQCWAQIPSPVETTPARSADSLALVNTNLPASDPDSGRALLSRLRRSGDALKVDNTVSSIYTERRDQAEQRWLDLSWSKADLSGAEESAKIELPKAGIEQLSLRSICRATGVVLFRGSPQNIAKGGTLTISHHGLAITSLHVANLINGRSVIVLIDGTVAQIIKIIAGNARTDFAIVQLDNQNLPWILIAESEPLMNACNGFMPVELPAGIGLMVGLIFTSTLETILPMNCGGAISHRPNLGYLSSLSFLDAPTQSGGTQTSPKDRSSQRSNNRCN